MKIDSDIELVTLAQVAKRFNLSLKGLYRIYRRDQWPVIRIGRAIRFDIAEVLKFLKENTP